MSHRDTPSLPIARTSLANSAPCGTILPTSTRSRRLQDSWQIAPSPSSVAIPIAAAKLPSEPPGETTSCTGVPITDHTSGASRVFNASYDIRHDFGLYQPVAQRSAFR
jgi:hypothetical protein